MKTRPGEGWLLLTPELKRWDCTDHDPIEDWVAATLWCLEAAALNPAPEGGQMVWFMAGVYAKPPSPYPAAPVIPYAGVFCRRRRGWDA